MNLIAGTVWLFVDWVDTIMFVILCIETQDAVWVVSVRIDLFHFDD